MWYATIAAGILSISKNSSRGTDMYHINGTVGSGILITSGDSCGVVMTDGFEFCDIFLCYNEENKSLQFANTEVELNRIALIGLHN